MHVERFNGGYSNQFYRWSVDSGHTRPKERNTKTTVCRADREAGINLCGVFLCKTAETDFGDPVRDVAPSWRRHPGIREGISFRA